MQRPPMVLPTRARIVLALEAAARSPLVSGARVDRPWMRFTSFLLIGVVLLIGLMLISGAALAAFTSASARLVMTGPIPDSPMRLADEGAQGLFLGLALGMTALAILTAAVLAYRRPWTWFLWPGRRFAPGHLAVGFLATACISIILMPLHLAMGSEWAPPVLDPRYLDQTRLTYVLAMTAGLLVAAAAEEVVFRGVLLRLTGFVTRRPLLLCLINGLLFSAIHLDPDPVAFVARALSGMVWTWATLRLGGLEFAVGSHLATNLVICLFWAPLSDVRVAGESRWIDLGPEILAALVAVVIVERLAGPPGRRTALAARPAA